MLKQLISIFCLGFLPSTFLLAQEKVCGLQQNNALLQQNNFVKNKKTRSQSLPFFDDFTNKGPYPDANKWQDNKVYINNTFSNNQIARGVATFDALNEHGLSYYPTGNVTQFYADSLTSQAVDLSSYTSADNIYLSFFYQPQGLGFMPEPSDSLLLFFLDKNNNWVNVWSKEGSATLPFNQIVLPISNSIFMHNNFQFRFVNIVSPNINDDVWNLDYVRIDKNRYLADTTINDVGFTLQPTGILSNYTSMPYKHFINNTSTEQATNFSVFLQNNYVTSINTNITLKAKETISGTSIYSNNTAITINGYGVLNNSFTQYPISYAPTNANDTVNITNTFYINKVSPNDPVQNDTIVQNNVFANYFSYDDGSAEKAYFLYPAINTPAKVAMQFHTNVADTIGGLAINFAKQVPSGAGKLFSIVLYQNLGNNTSTEVVLGQQDFCSLQYIDTIQGFSYYAFENPISIQPGTYYVGVIQPTNNGSDSIYFGLDQNTNANATHLFYNVDGSWNQSATFGTVMLRPVTGKAFIPTSTNNLNVQKNNISIFPNPTNDFIYFETDKKIKLVNIISIDGSSIQKTSIHDNKIPVSSLNNGVYFLQFYDFQNNITNLKFIKN